MQDIIEAAATSSGDEPTPRTSWNPEAFLGDDGMVHIVYAGAELVFELHRAKYLAAQLNAIES